uniref:Uncharacterized protein n=1 Tax=viral metagenome TaxID=1070528 RepID=A0A6C0JSH7_9ZZZZ
MTSRTIIQQFLDACDNNDMVVVRKLITYVDPACNDNLAIEWACENGYLELTRFLLSFPSVDPSTDNNRPIRIASRFGHTEVVRLLLTDQRVDPSAKNNQALEWAKLYNQPAVVDLLTEYQFRLDGPEYTRGIL